MRTQTKPDSYLKKRFEEERARLLLINLFFEDYNDSVLNESPDIISKNNEIGTEVVNATKEDIQEKLSHSLSIIGKNINELNDYEKENIDKGEIECISKIGKKICASSFPAYWGSDFDFNKTIIKKLKKSNEKNFNKRIHNRLFVYAWMLDEMDIKYEHVFEEIESVIYEKFETIFETIYIFSGAFVIVYDANKHSFNTINISKELVREISSQAKCNIFGTLE